MAGDWKATTIGDQVVLQRGFDITKPQQRPGDIPVVSTAGVLSFHDTPMASGPGVVIGRKGNSIGRAHYVEKDFWPHDTTLWVKDFKHNDPRFVFYFFANIASRLHGMDVGSANPTLNRNHVHQLSVSWPPIDQQRAIARILSTLDDKIELNRRMNETLEAMARALFTSWFVDFDPVHDKTEGRDSDLPKPISDLFPNRFVDSELGEIPKGWRASKLGSEAETVLGGTPSRAIREYWGGDIPWINSMTFVSSGRVSSSPQRGWILLLRRDCPRARR
jgi:type I restriction enzyme, S subunit